MIASPSAGERAPRILVCGWAGAGNIGDELLATEIIGLLRARGAEPVVVSRNPAATRHSLGVESVPWGPRGAPALRHVDGVCLGPGGLFQDTSSVWSLPANLFVPVLASFTRRPIASVGVGAEVLRRRSSRWLLRRALSGAPVVTRDAQSSDVLNDVGLNAVTSVDLVSGRSVPMPSRRPEILVAVGPVVGAGALRPAKHRLAPIPAETIASAIQRLAEMMDCSVVFGAFRGDRDRSASQQIASHLSVGHRILDDDPDAHVEQVAASLLVVSSRYHPIVLAALSGTPVIAVSNQAKVRSLVAQIAGRELGAAVQAEAWDQLPDAASIPRHLKPITLPGLEHVGAALDQLVAAARAEKSGQK